MERTQLRYIARSLYKAKRNYGKTFDLYRIEASGTSRRSGLSTRTISKVKIKRGIVMPSQAATRFLYDLGNILLSKDFSQGGFFDVNEQVFIIDASDLPKGYELDQEDYIVYKGKKFEIRTIRQWEDASAYVLKARETEGDVFTQVHCMCVYDLLILEDEIT